MLQLGLEDVSMRLSYQVYFAQLCKTNHIICTVWYERATVGYCQLCWQKEFLLGMVLYKTKSLDGTKPSTNPKTNSNPNTNSIQLFYAIFEHRPMILKLASFVRFSHRSNTVLLPWWLLVFTCHNTHKVNIGTQTAWSSFYLFRHNTRVVPITMTPNLTFKVTQDLDLDR